MGLNETQTNALSRAMGARCRALKLPHSDFGRMHTTLKKKFLPRESRSVMTFRDIKQEDFPAALDHIIHWCPHRRY